MTPKILHKYENNIELKRCSKCIIYRSLDNYNKSKQSWDKLRPTCKVCLTKERAENKDKIRKYNVEYWEKTKDTQLAKHKIWRENNKEHIKQKNKEYRKLHGKETDKKTWQKRKKKLQDDEEYKKKCAEWRRKYEKEKRETNINFKLKSNISRRIREILKQKKSQSAMKYVGCSFEELKKHLENSFDEKMTWDNYEEWNIDHIIPCSSFNMENEFELNACFYYKNLQPLWGIDNILKKNNYVEKEKNNYIEYYKQHIKYLENKNNISIT